jgi:GGDEF domain-containing protein
MLQRLSVRSYIALPLDSSSGSGALTLCALASGTDVFTQAHLTCCRSGPSLTYEWESVKWRADLRRLASGLRDPQRTDSVTGLLNRVALVEAAEREWRLASRGTLETYVLAFRVSNLGTVSARHGAAVAELMLKDAADVMQSAIRRTDYAGRLATTCSAPVLVGCKGLEGAAAFIGRYGQALPRVTAERPAQLETLLRDLLARRRGVPGGRSHAHRGRGPGQRGRARRGGRVSAEASTATPPPPKGIVPPSEAGGRSGFLSDVIVELGFASADAVEEAVREARSGSTVAQVLSRAARSARSSWRGHGRAVRARLRRLESFEVDPQAAALIRPSAAKRYQAVPVGFAGERLLVAMTDPADSLAVDDIAVITKLEVEPVAATRSGLDKLLADLAAAGAASDGPGSSGAGAAGAPTSSAVFWQADDARASPHACWARRLPPAAGRARTPSRREPSSPSCAESWRGRRPSW